MNKEEKTYHFTGNKEDIINSILSLLFGKDIYQESSFYSSFINDSQPESYRKKIKAALYIMQRENLILIRDGNTEGGRPLIHNNPETVVVDLPSDSARIYLRQHGKDILSLGGFKYASFKVRQKKGSIGVSIPFSSKLIIILLLIAAITYII